MRELLYKTMFIMSIVSAFAVVLYGTGGPTMPFTTTIPTLNNPFAPRTVTLYPAGDGSQAPVNIRGFICTGPEIPCLPEHELVGPEPNNCDFTEAIINTTNTSHAKWYGCLRTLDAQGSYATLGYSAGGNSWYTLSLILDPTPNDGRSWLITNVTVNYQCHGQGDYPVFGIIPRSGVTPLAIANLSLGFVSKAIWPVSPATAIGLTLASYLLPILNAQTYGGSTAGITANQQIAYGISNPSGVCPSTGDSNLGPYTLFHAYAYGQDMNGQNTGDLSFAGDHLDKIFGGSGANLLIWPSGHGSSDLIQMSYVSITITYQADAGCSLISGGDIFTSVANAVGYIGCVLSGWQNFASDLATGSINFFLYLVNWGSFIIQTVGNYLSVLVWLYSIPGLPTIVQTFVSAVVSLWIAIIGIEIYKAIDPFGG